MKLKKKNTKEESKVESPSFTEVEIDELLNAVEESIEEIKEAQTEPTVVEEIKAEVVKAKQSTKKAYNIWQNTENRMYMLDVIEYDKDGVVSFETRQLGLSQPMAMYEIKRIFTDKLILKRGGL